MCLNVMDIHQFTQDSPLFLCQKTQGQQANASVISASRFFLALTHSLTPTASASSVKNGCAVFEFISQRRIIITARGVEREQERSRVRRLEETYGLVPGNVTLFLEKSSVCACVYV